ncbi:DUF927 domain-containing protein [Tatumella sp. JGM130]|uniref:DUF927 domain-containing protein n=1 Tax=Tatumella sp. JGM130 TaxID=2799797 RepID=UPI001BAF22AC|nr:DUF927 domain-containing protein [Tatumella sp. JGM130]MBS0895225.1 DUF927 domain-containing protein [Tatumella sp. JGM130]
MTNKKDIDYNKKFKTYKLLDNNEPSTVLREIKVSYIEDFVLFEPIQSVQYHDHRPLDLLANENFSVFEEETLWYEDNEYIMTSEGVYTKASDKSDNVFIYDLEIIYPIICCGILEPKNARDKKVHYSIKFKISGLSTDESKEYSRKSRYCMCSLPSNEMFTYDAKGSTPKHQDRGWGTEQDHSKKKVLSKILSRTSAIAPVREGYKTVGWQIKKAVVKDESTGVDTIVIADLEHITPNHHRYIGDNYEYLDCQGSYGIYRETQEKLIINSPLYALGNCFGFSSLVKGMFEVHPVINVNFNLYGPPHKGKSTILLGILLNFTNQNLGVSNSQSTFVGLENELYDKNNFCVFIEEYDDLFVKDPRNAISQQVSLANGGGRKKSGAESKYFYSSIISTSNENLDKIVSSVKDAELKGEALKGRVQQFDIMNPDLHTFIEKPLYDEDGAELKDQNGNTVYNLKVNTCIELLKENYGWGYNLAIDFLKRKRHLLKGIYDKKMAEYKDRKLLENHEQKDRVLSTLCYMSIGIEIIREVISEKAANACIEALTIYEQMLEKELLVKSPEMKSKEEIIRLLRAVAYSPQSVYWSNFAYSMESKDCSKERKVKIQTEKAHELNSQTSPKHISIRQNRVFDDVFDFDCEVIISREDFYINGELFTKSKLEEVAESLNLFKIEKNGKNRVKVVKGVKRLRNDESDFFNGEVSGLIKFNINLRDLINDEAELQSLVNDLAGVDTYKTIESDIDFKDLPEPVKTTEIKREKDIEVVDALNAFFDN